MRRRSAILGLSFMLLLLNSWPAGACGDKLLILGRGARFDAPASSYPSRILLYVNPGSLTEPYKEDRLQLLLEKANHRLKSVKTREDLATELRTGNYALILADFADAPRLDEMVQASSSKPVLLPWVDKENRAVKSKAEKQYHFVLGWPATDKLLLSTIERTMEKRDKLVRTQDKGGSKHVSLLR
jgi:hypothetical protein